MNSVEDPDRLGIHISDELAHLALTAADLFKSLPPKELLKAESTLTTMNGSVRKTAKNLKEVAALVGFVFSMEMAKVRDARLKQLQEAGHAAE